MSERFIPAPAGNGLPLHSVHYRFIPAPAGNGASILNWMWRSTGSSPRLRGTELPTVHPRACGERSNGRGTPANGVHRFIPAPAGNGQVSGRLRRPRPVHPRACGERGLHSNQFIRPRFIPAPAGNGRRQSAPLTVHPRACGEQHVRLRQRMALGSSPRLRGTEPWK